MTSLETNIRHLEKELEALQIKQEALNRQYAMAERILAEGDPFGNTSDILYEIGIEIDTISDIKSSLQNDLEELLLELGQQETAERIKMKALYEKF